MDVIFLTYVKLIMYMFYATNLSKGTSDLKQKCTQFAKPFWDTVFHALSHGVIHFVSSV